MKKILIAFIVLPIIFIGGVVIYINENIDDSKINKLVVDSIEGSLIGVKANIKKMNYDLGLSVNIQLEGLSVKDSRTKLDIFSLKNTEIQINIFSILLGGGKVDINIDNPTLNLSKNIDGELNLSKYLPSATQTEKETANSKEENISFEVPSFVENSKLNFKLTNLLVNYRDKVISKFKIDKILLKNLNMKNPTAYELDSNIDYSMSKEDSISFRLKFFGELKLDELITKKELGAISYLYIQDISTNLVKNKLPNIESKVELSLNEASSLDLDISTKIKEILNSKISVSVKKENMMISLNEISLNLKKSLNLIELKTIKVNDANLILNGNINSDLAFSKVEPNLMMSLSEKLLINVDDINMGINKANLMLKNELLDLNVDTSIFDGVVSLKTKMNLDLINLPSSIDSLTRISSKVEVKDVVIPSKYIESTDATEKKNIEASKGVKQDTSSTLVPNTNTNFLVENLSLGTAKISSNGTVTSAGYNISSKKMSVSIDKSKTNLSFNVNLKRGINSKFNVKSSKVDLESFKSFIPKEFGELSGVMDISINGKTDNEGYDIHGDLNAVDGSLKGLKLKEIISSFIGKLAKFLPKKEINISENYDSLTSSFHATQTKVDISKLNIVGKDKSLNLNLKGNIQQDSKESKLLGTILLRDYAKDVKKVSGKSALPLMLKGEGYSLTPSISYTTNRFVKNKAKEEVNKLKNSIEKKAKDLFKGFKL